MISDWENISKYIITGIAKSDNEIAELKYFGSIAINKTSISLLSFKAYEIIKNSVADQLSNNDHNNDQNIMNEISFQNKKLESLIENTAANCQEVILSSDLVVTRGKAQVPYIFYKDPSKMSAYLNIYFRFEFYKLCDYNNPSNPFFEFFGSISDCNYSGLKIVNREVSVCENKFYNDIIDLPISGNNRPGLSSILLPYLVLHLNDSIVCLNSFIRKLVKDLMSNLSDKLFLKKVTFTSRQLSLKLNAAINHLFTCFFSKNPSDNKVIEEEKEENFLFCSFEAAYKDYLEKYLIKIGDDKAKNYIRIWSHQCGPFTSFDCSKKFLIDPEKKIIEVTINNENRRLKSKICDIVGCKQQEEVSKHIFYKLGEIWSCVVVLTCKCIPSKYYTYLFNEVKNHPSVISYSNNIHAEFSKLNNQEEVKDLFSIDHIVSHEVDDKSNIILNIVWTDDGSASNEIYDSNYLKFPKVIEYFNKNDALNLNSDKEFCSNLEKLKLTDQSCLYDERQVKNPVRSTEKSNGKIN